MKPCGNPWSQLTIEEKVEELHKLLDWTARSLNQLIRVVYPLLEKKRQKEAKNEQG